MDTQHIPRSHSHNATSIRSLLLHPISDLANVSLITTVVSDLLGSPPEKINTFSTGKMIRYKVNTSIDIISYLRSHFVSNKYKLISINSRSSNVSHITDHVGDLTDDYVYFIVVDGETYITDGVNHLLLRSKQ